MLSVNADDLGRDKAATDAALACFARGRMTSASAMVFMADSQRAAELARASGLEVGLHLNLSERLSARQVPDRLCEDHDRIRRCLGGSRFAFLLYHPLLTSAFERVVGAQCEEFERLYRRAPTHIDGHHHLHLATNVLLQQLLPAGSRVRRNFSFTRGQKSTLNLWYRRRVDTLLARRHRIGDEFYALSQHLARDAIERLAARAERAEVEVMTHPASPREFAFLMSDAYGEVMCGASLSLAAPAPARGTAHR
jgi:predicted glycoside hydrolase/deacetylase ChbG (UPF0249 family)